MDNEIPCLKIEYFVQQYSERFWEFLGTLAPVIYSLKSPCVGSNKKASKLYNKVKKHTIITHMLDFANYRKYTHRREKVTYLGALRLDCRFQTSRKTFAEGKICFFSQKR